MKEHSPEADRGESKRVEGHMMKGSSLRTHMYWSALHYIVELHLLGLHREKMHQKTSGGVSVSCCFHGVWLIGSEVS